MNDDMHYLFAPQVHAEGRGGQLQIGNARALHRALRRNVCTMEQHSQLPREVDLSNYQVVNIGQSIEWVSCDQPVQWTEDGGRSIILKCFSG